MAAKINYADSVARKLPEKAANILLEVLDSVNIGSALVTSTTRTPEEQARIMYENLEAHGIAAQRGLYKGPGNQVIDVYENLKSIGQTADLVKWNMSNKIREIGPQTVSHHCVDISKLSVFDVAPSSIPEDKREDFIVAVSLNASIDKFLKPPADPAFHIEIVL